MADPKINYSHLFIAAPELLFETAMLEYLVDKGLIDEQALEFATKLRRDRERLRRIRDRVKGQTLFTRIMSIAPEILTPTVIDILRRFDVIGIKEGHILRLALKAMKINAGGIPVTKEEMLRRARKLLGLGYSEEAIALLLSMGSISTTEANRLRAAVSSGAVSFETLRKVRHAKTLADLLALVGSGLIDKRSIDALRLSGLIDNRTANALLMAISYGRAQWTVFQGAKRAQGLAARMAYTVSGSFSFEALDLLNYLGKLKKKELEALGLGYLYGRLTPENLLLLKFAIQVSQRYNRELMEQLTERRFRVLPGESPIVTYARAAKQTDDALLRLLAESADEAAKEAQRLAGTRAVRGAEYALRARALHQAMRQVWEGVGYITIFGEHQVAHAATEAMEALGKRYTNQLPEFTQRMLAYQARSGLDSYISRQENTLQLSRRVYGNLNLFTNKVDKRISMSLLQGKSAAEIAKDVKKYINPTVPGGVKYAAMRLGRTELANAFHYTTIRHTREQPWVRGYKWNRSSSHGHNDICDEYANDDHDNLGPGVFKKANVPGKPHPHCMCYVTVVEMDENEFLKAFKAGRFDQYINSRIRPPDIQERAVSYFAEKTAQQIGKAAGQIAITQGFYALDRMMQSGKKANVGFNPVKVSKQLEAAKQAKFPFMANNAVVQSMISEINDALPDDRGPITKAENKKISDSLAKFEKKAAKSGAQLAARQQQFRVMLKKEFDHAKKFGDGAFDQENYENILHGAAGAGSGHNFATGMYGSRAYRLINSTLRSVKGKLGKYDSDLEDGIGWLAEDLEKLDPTDPDYWMNAAKVFDRFKTLDPSQDEAHYASSIQSYLQHWSKSLPTWAVKPSGIVDNLDKLMEPTDIDSMVYRVTGPDFFGLGGKMPTIDDIGHIFKDHAYTSTEGIKNYFSGSASAEMMLDLTSRQAKIRMFLPQGTLATRLNDIEYEILLSRGSKFQILDVQDGVIDLMLLSQEKLKAHSLGFLTATEDDMWDAIMGDF